MKNKNVYTKEMMIREIAEESHKDLRTVRRIYGVLEEMISRLLSSADMENDIVVKLFEGISINSSFVPEKTKINNLTGETIKTISKVKPKANITRNYCEKLSSMNKGT